MLDFHNHILPGIDDGAPDTEQSLILIRGLQELGFDRIHASPHIIADTHPNSPKTIEAARQKLSQAIEAQGMTLSIHAAAEYMLDDVFLSNLKAKQPLLRLGGDRVLVEFSYIQKPDHVESYSFEMQIQGYEPVLAHPERYGYYHRDFEYYEYLKGLGFEFQLNLLSLTPYYGRDVQKAAERLLKAGMYDFACTDMHHERHLEAMRAHFDKGKLQDLFDKYELKNDELLA
ncbi:MAG: histidinol phosphatase [Bacteroidetes bacterium]|nr:histidinol phosphatase [Bacteroidota bacterium]MDA0943613.1 histidinol phosphatase [Bacteroidota bacterium]MDA1111766.1 histidinol phosphatase [Bacteroidota bacterium]